MNYTSGGFPVWDEEFDKEHFTPEEIAESDFKAAIITALVQARKSSGMTQRELAAISGVKQPVISRIEKGKSVPNVGTLLKILSATGKTLQVVPIKAKKA